MKGASLRRFAEGIALAAPILLVGAPFLLSSRSLYGREFKAYFRSHALYAQEMSARDGEWPRWNSRQYAGTPFLGDFQGSLHYPPNLLYLFAAPERAFGLLFLLHMLAAAMGIHRLLRYLRLGRGASVLAGVAYGVSLSVTRLMDAGLLNAFVTQALAPWVLLLTLRVIKRPTLFRVSLLAAAGAAVLLGGNPKGFGPLALLAAGLGTWNLARARMRGRPWKASLAALAAAAVLGGMLSASTMLPALEVARFAVWDPATLPVAALELSKELYIGAIPLVLALVALKSLKRGPILFFAIAGGAAAAVGFLGQRLPVRSLWITTLCLSALAGCGWETVTRGKQLFLARPWPSAVVIALSAIELCGWNHSIIKTLSAEEYSKAPWYESKIGGERDDYRLLDITTTEASPTAHGFRLLNGYDYPRLASLQTTSDALPKLNVRWLVSTMAPPYEHWRRVVEHEGRVLYENPLAMRAAFVLPPDPRSAEPLSIRRKANSIEVSGRSYQPEKLVVSESWMPGWKAYAQRRRIKVQAFEGSLLSVDVPSGDWYITFRYDPNIYRIGRILSSSALMAVFTLLIAGMKRSKLAIS